MTNGMNNLYIIQRTEGQYWSEEGTWTYDRMDAKEYNHAETVAEVNRLQDIYKHHALIYGVSI